MRSDLVLGQFLAAGLGDNAGSQGERSRLGGVGAQQPAPANRHAASGPTRCGRRRRLGDPQRSRRQPAAEISREILEVAGGLAVLAVVNEETRSSVFAALEVGDVPDYASAYQELFAAVEAMAQMPGRALTIRLSADLDVEDAESPLRPHAAV